MYIVNYINTEHTIFCYRLNFSTAFSTNVVSICRAVNLNKVTRIEVAIRYCIKHKGRLNKTVENAVCISLILLFGLSILICLEN